MTDHKLHLGVNVDHVATVRQARYPVASNFQAEQIEPNVVDFALSCERAGAAGITIHLREDRRHIQVADTENLRKQLQTQINFEMACTDAMIDFALKLKPASVCIVPENREEVTTEGGLDVLSNLDRIQTAVDRFQSARIKTSLFVDPDADTLEACSDIGTDMVELHTGAFANGWFDQKVREAELQKLIDSAELADARGMIVNVGHGINYLNIDDILKIPHLKELNIGHSIIARSLFVGVEQAVREMIEKMSAY